MSIHIVKLHNLFLLFLLLFPMQEMLAQVSQQLLTNYLGNHNSNSNEPTMAIDSDDNILVTGYLPNYGAKGSHGIVKFDPSGNAIWESGYSGTPISIITDFQSNVYVTGTAQGVGTGSDFITAKYDSTGQQLWLATYNGLGNEDEEARSIAVDSMQNVYVTGIGISVSGNYFTITTKYNNVGQLEWSKIYEIASYEYVCSKTIAVSKNGKIFVAGYGNVYSFGPSKYFVLHYGASGELKWEALYFGPDSSSNFLTCMTIDENCNIYASGYGYGIGYDIVTVKFDSSGIQKWVARDGAYGSEVAWSIRLDRESNICVAGSLRSGGDYSDFVTIKYDSDGNKKWLATFNGPAGNRDEAIYLDVDNQNNIYVSGISTSQSGDYDLATVKYNKWGVRQWSISYDGADSISYDIPETIGIDSFGNLFVNGTEGRNNERKFLIKYRQSDFAIKVNAKLLIEGLYYPVFNMQSRRDTVRAYLASTNPPYVFIDSAVSVIDSLNFKGVFAFRNAPTGQYYLVVKHFNSIETWSKQGGELFKRDTIDEAYDYTLTASQAYGDNMKLKGSKYCMYSGDINQSGFIDGSDAIRVHSDSQIFLTGRFLITDLNGDNIVDGTDYLIVDNNAYNFIGVVRP